MSHGGRKVMRMDQFRHCRYRYHSLLTAIDPVRQRRRKRSGSIYRLPTVPISTSIRIVLHVHGKLSKEQSKQTPYIQETEDKTHWKTDSDNFYLRNRSLRSISICEIFNLTTRLFLFALRKAIERACFARSCTLVFAV